MSEVDKILEQNKKLQEKLPGKKKTEKNEISSSCASGDNVYLGFGNGTLAVVDTSREPNPGKIHSELIENFSGDEGHPIDKMRVVYIEGPTPAESDSHLLSLTNGSIICHNMPELRPTDDVLDINEFILDFEVYRHSSSKSLRASAQNKNFIVILSADVNLKIFKWNKSFYEYITKVPLELMSLPSQMRSS